jgi:flagellar biosynthesis regulator FlbT
LSYYKIFQKYPALIQPPNIKISTQRTILSFQTDNDLALFSTAFMAILPFQDATTTKKNIYNMVDMMRAEVINRKNIKGIKTVKQLIILLSEAMRIAKILEQTKKTLEVTQKLRFFKAHTRTILTNSQGKSLTIYANPQFGKKLTSNKSGSSQTAYTLPDLEMIADFLQEVHHLH